MKKAMKKIMTIFMAIALAVACLPAIPAIAAGESQEVREAKNGIVQVNVSYVDSATGKTQLIQGGSGFLIGDDATGAQTVITNYHVVNLDEGVIAAFKEWYGVADFNTRIEVVVKGDVVVTASIENQSVEADYAILKLDQPLHDKSTLTLDIYGDVTETEMIYALGFPATVTYVQDNSSYTSDDVTITSGTISKIITIGGSNYIQHNAALTEGNSGGPLLNADGVVVGVNTFGVDDSSYYSLQMSEITEVLDTLGIAYKSNDSEPITEEPTEETTTESTEVAVDKNQLQALVSGAASVIESDYTEESYAAYKSAVDAGSALLDNPDATQEQVNAAVSNIREATAGLETAKTTGLSSNSLILIIVIAVAVIVIIAVIVIVVVMTSKNKKAAATVAPRPMPPVQQPIASVGGNPTAPPVPPVRQNVGPASAPVPPRPMPVVGEGAGETSVLNVGAGETSVLSATNQTPATLIRLKTGEKVDIRKQTFKLGKERNKVDYCIANNNSVSRIHATISYKNGGYYITDMNSTNNTFVNDQMIRANDEVKLANNDRIKLSDEEFQIKF